MPAAELHAAGRGDRRAAALPPPHAGGLPHRRRPARGPVPLRGVAGRACATTPRPEPEADPYEALKERARARNAALSLAGRDIGELPAVVDPERKAQAASDFRFFCETYFPLTFHLPWSPDHLKVIAKIEQAVLHGGLFAMAMPRGSGKTTHRASAPASGRCSTGTASSSA